jgi:hypothetical protein
MLRLVYMNDWGEDANLISFASTYEGAGLPDERREYIGHVMHGT